jgi:hypothetical protein
MFGLSRPGLEEEEIIGILQGRRGFCLTFGPIQTTSNSQYKLRKQLKNCKSKSILMHLKMFSSIRNKKLRVIFTVN